MKDAYMRRLSLPVLRGPLRAQPMPCRRSSRWASCAGGGSRSPQRAAELSEDIARIYDKWFGEFGPPSIALQLMYAITVVPE